MGQTDGCHFVSIHTLINLVIILFQGGGEGILAKLEQNLEQKQ